MPGKWGRRAISIPALLVALTLGSLLLPVLLVVAALVDAVRALSRKTPWIAVRIVLFGELYLLLEVIGLASLFGVWLGTLPLGRARSERLLAATYAVQRLWASSLFIAVKRLFGLSLEVEGESVLEPGPLVLFVRHASVIDTLLPTVLVSARFGTRLRFVLKRELLVDPCLDVAGSRLPNVFVRRSGEDDRDIEAVAELARGLGPKDGVLIFPEGTRFTPDKQRRALQRLREKSPELYELARSLTHVLPPRLGGALALLESATEADLVFFAHVGLDGFASVTDIFRYALSRRVVRVKLWRIPRQAVPDSRQARTEFLLKEWQKLDDWVAAELGVPHAATSKRSA